MKRVFIKATDITLLPDGYAMGNPDTKFIMLRDDISIEDPLEDLYFRRKPTDLIRFTIQDNKFIWEFSGYRHETYLDPQTQEFSRIMLQIQGEFFKSHKKKTKK